MSITQQPEALHLAEKLRDMCSRFNTPSHERGVINGAIQELHRLEAANAKLRAGLDELKEQMAAIGAGGVESLRKRAEAAPQAVQATAVPEAIEQMAADRYKVVPSHESMFHRWAVVADNGEQQLYIGREGECQNMARKFMGAFLDGAFVAMQNAAAPQIDWESAAEEIAIEVADNCGTVPNLTHPHIYLGLKKLFATAPVVSDEDHVLVPRGLIGAACYAIEKKRDGIKTLAELRRYTKGDLSASAPQPPVTAAVQLPVELLERIQESLGSFVSDQGWSQFDMDTADALNGLLAAHGITQEKQG